MPYTPTLTYTYLQFYSFTYNYLQKLQIFIFIYFLYYLLSKEYVFIGNVGAVGDEIIGRVSHFFRLWLFPPSSIPENLPFLGPTRL